MTASWQVWALGAAAFAAMTAIFAKLGVQTLPSDFATLLRTLVVVVMLAAIVAATGQYRPLGEISPQGLAFLIASGLATGASWLCYFRALKLADASRVAPVDKLSVVLVAIFGAMFLGERLGAKAWLGVGLIFVGVLLVMSRD